VRFERLTTRNVKFCHIELTAEPGCVYRHKMTKPPNRSPFLNISEFAQLMGVTRQTVHNWLICGTCPIEPVDGRTPRKWLRHKVDTYLIEGR
jgi:predicted DNA-binding transcriptional regulator AlpA